MTVSILVPSLGESIVEASVSRWLKPLGGEVTVDEPLVELETDKVTVEVPAPVSGRLGSIAAEPGMVVIVGSILGTVEQGVEAGFLDVEGALRPAVRTSGTEADYAPSPSARKLIEENGIDIATLHGGGRDGRITKSDVLSVLSVPSAPAETPPSVVLPTPQTDVPKERRVRMSKLRQRIAQRLKEAQNAAAILTTFNEVDMTELATLRKKHQEAFEGRHGVRLGFMSFFVKACIVALKEWPNVNAEISGDEVVYKDYYDIGVAVGTKAGLVVPVVKGADSLSFAEVEKAIAGLGEKARNGRLTIEEMTGGTFTISNGGIYGSLMSTPIINPPQSGILGMHKIMQRPMVMEDGSIAARPMMYLALSYDHRLIDGREAVSFLVRVKECIENPARILLEA
ncbi:dihydrolipoyllysine-residue succinyltransferase component of 2-oxoglutarate dehydrogenase complex [Alphaproteobacteria bacterium]|nr:dihydrolipoyllysine-residue succinyltransferase component of 2-oxoglutarate dehydrogenase complex [Alphaproteobacteria bacterium]